MKFDLSLYLVTDPRFSHRRTLEQQVRRAVEGGVTIVQLRDKHASAEDVLRTAELLLKVLQPYGVPLLINDHVDIALKAGAHGVHLGQSDMHPDMARQRLGPQSIIGWSIESFDDLARLPSAVDYVAASSVFSTDTKLDVAIPFGLSGLQKLRAQCLKPLIGIGGISAHNVWDVLRQGVDGIAVISAILAAEDPKIAAEELKNIIQSFRESHHAS